MSNLISRRQIIKRGALCLAAANSSSLFAADETAKPVLRFGMLTDLHYADKAPASNRHYRETLAKLEQTVTSFNATPHDFVVELGDFIDRAENVEQELEWLSTIEAQFAKLKSPRHYVLGNHCVETLTKDEFANHTGMNHPPHHAFEYQGASFIILDACFREDGVAYGRKNSHWQDSNIPPSQLDWLKSTLEKISSGPVIVFAHQRLDENKHHSVRNAAAVRQLLEESGKVTAVFQGHSHKNDYQQINHIHYTTLVAMIEGSGLDSSGHATLELMPDASLRLHGFYRQQDRNLTPGKL
jgi:predicted phosphodiesterase